MFYFIFYHQAELWILKMSHIGFKEFIRVGKSHYILFPVKCFREYTESWWECCVLWRSTDIVNFYSQDP